jgi:hypothetical protein
MGRGAGDTATIDAPTRSFSPGFTDAGLPRPLHPLNGRPAPVPWSQEIQKDGKDAGAPHWGAISDPRQLEAIAKSLCLLCGKPVEKGLVFVAKEDLKRGKRILRAYKKSDLSSRAEIIDHAPLHPRCAKLSKAHCPYLRDATDVLERPYG